MLGAAECLNTKAQGADGPTQLVSSHRDQALAFRHRFAQLRVYTNILNCQREPLRELLREGHFRGAMGHAPSRHESDHTETLPSDNDGDRHSGAATFGFDFGPLSGDKVGGRSDSDIRANPDLQKPGRRASPKTVNRARISQ